MLTFQKDSIFLQFDEEKGSIHSLKDAYREYVGEEVPVFQMAILDEAGEQIRLSKEDFCFDSCKVQEDGFFAVYKNKDINVTVYAQIAENIRWKIAVDVQEDKVLEWVDFPQLAVPSQLKRNGGDSRILWGFSEGVVIEDIEYKENGDCKYTELQYPSIPVGALYPGIVESQFVAYYNEKSGLYYGAHDKEDHIKGIDFYPVGKGIMIQFRHYSGCHYGERYEMKFPMVMQSFRGEWQDAAQIYKDWFKQNKAEEFIPIEENPVLPDWYSQSPVVITYPVRGLHDMDIMNPNKMYPYCNALPHVERLEKELNSKIMVILMHWEGTAPWAPPYVWPPFGGEEELQKFIDALHERGDVIGVYCSGLGWTQYSKLIKEYRREAEFEEKNLQEVMCRSPKQELPYSKVVDFIRKGYDMCPTQKFTVDVMRDQVKHMAAAGIDYIQLMDQQSGGTSYFCYSKNHGHPPIPGKWQVDAVKNLFAEVEKEIGQVLIGTEVAAGESYIPQLLFNDNRFLINYAVGQPVPLYAYLYHEYINNFTGNQVCTHMRLDHKRSPINALERLGYSFSTGDMLTLVLDEDGDISWNWGWRDPQDKPDQQSIKDFVREANGWRQGIGKKYLHTGNMVKPYKVNCEKNSIYSVKGYELQMEKIHTSAWVTKQGEYGQFLINYNPEDVECEICLPDGKYRLYESGEGYRGLESGVQKIKVKKLSVVLVEREYTDFEVRRCLER